MQVQRPRANRKLAGARKSAGVAPRVAPCWRGRRTRMAATRLASSAQPTTPAHPSSSAHPATPSPSSLSFVAGAISGAAGQAVGHPLDTLNIHAQAGRSTEHLRFWSLWRGASVPVMTVGAINSLALGVFENVRRALWPYESPTPLPVLAAAGTSCGLTVSVVTCPLSRVKILQQLTGARFFVGVQRCRESGTLFRAYPTAAVSLLTLTLLLLTLLLVTLLLLTLLLLTLLTHNPTTPNPADPSPNPNPTLASCGRVRVGATWSSTRCSSARSSQRRRTAPYRSGRGYSRAAAPTCSISPRGTRSTRCCMCSSPSCRPASRQQQQQQQLLILLLLLQQQQQQQQQAQASRRGSLPRCRGPAGSLTLTLTLTPTLTLT